MFVLLPPQGHADPAPLSRLIRVPEAEPLLRSPPRQPPTVRLPLLMFKLLHE